MAHGREGASARLSAARRSGRLRSDRRGSPALSGFSGSGQPSPGGALRRLAPASRRFQRSSAAAQTGRLPAARRPVRLAEISAASSGETRAANRRDSSTSVSLAVTAPGAVAGLVGRDRDGRGDAVPAQPGPVRLGGVRLVGQDPGRAAAGSPGSRAGDPDRVQHRDQLGAVAVLAGCEDEREHPAALVDRGVGLGAPPAPGAAQRVVIRLSGNPTESVLAGAGGVDVGAGSGGVHDACHYGLPTASSRTRSASSTRRQIPSTCQQANSAYTRHHGPYRCGTSRHGQPHRTRCRIPSTKPRTGHRRGRPWRAGGGSSGSSNAHWASLRSLAGRGVYRGHRGLPEFGHALTPPAFLRGSHLTAVDTPNHISHFRNRP